MATNAVELQVPDLAGAHSGENPFHMWLDACAYGIGGGLFQGPPLDEPDTPMVNTHYQTLGVTTWCTKQEIERRYQELRRLQKGAPLNDGGRALEEAYRTLLNDTSRAIYND